MPSGDLLLLAAASAVNAAMPGPCNLLTLSRSAAAGCAAGAAVTAGAIAATLILVSVSMMAALGALFISPTALEVLRWGGIFVLLWLAWRLLRPDTVVSPVRTRRSASPFGDVASGLLVGLSSPFNLVFFIALMPQFLPETGLGAYTATASIGAVLAGTVLSMSGVIAIGASAKEAFDARPAWIERGAGVAMILFAGMAAQTSMA
jgi:threonine/homoserine/homoserine lactone efflux protein